MSIGDIKTLILHKLQYDDISSVYNHFCDLYRQSFSSICNAVKTGEALRILITDPENIAMEMAVLSSAGKAIAARTIELQSELERFNPEVSKERQSHRK